MHGITKSRPSRATLRGLDLLNFLLADVQTGVGPFLAIYLAGHSWNEENVGLALSIGGFAAIVAQTPAGALVDRLRAKRALLAFGIGGVAAGALLIALVPLFWPIVAAQLVIGGASSVFIPAICAISLGSVGRKDFDRRQGRNQAYNSAGNVGAALLIGVFGYEVSNRSVFFCVALLAIPTLLSLLLIRPSDIDYELARGAKDGESNKPRAGAGELVKNRPLLIFLICSVAFHFANAAMLPLLGEMLAKGQGRASMLFISACVVTTQFVIALLAAPVGRMASHWGRRPLLLTGFSALPIRGILYTLTTNKVLLVAIQVLDGIGAGIFGVVSVLVIADLTRATGRFNVSLGAIATAVGIGAALSQVIAGAVVHHYSFNIGFFFLVTIALGALAILYFCMPETGESKFVNSHLVSARAKA